MSGRTDPDLFRELDETATVLVRVWDLSLEEARRLVVARVGLCLDELRQEAEKAVQEEVRRAEGDE